LALRVVGRGLDPAETTVADVMSIRRDGLTQNVDSPELPGVATLPEDTEIKDAVELMDEKQVRRVTVHDKHYRIVGVVSRADLPSIERSDELSTR